MDIENIRDGLHDWIDRRLEPLTRALTRLGVRPDQVTIAGTLISLVTPALIITDRLLLAGFVWLVGGALDLLDGAVARLQDKASARGAFLDSTLDRITEGAVFSAIAYHFAALGQAIDAALAVLALLGSLLISYTRARGEALGAQCKVGIATRAERVLLLALGLCLDQLQAVIYLLVGLTAYTVAQRIQHTLRELHAKL